MELVTPGIGLIFFQSLIFILVLIVLGKFVWKPIMKALKDREGSIEEALSAAEKARSEMSDLQTENENLIKEARAERDQMLKDAQKTASDIVSEAKGKAQEEASKLIKNAQESIQGEKRAALAEIQTLAAELSVDIAEKILKSELKDKKSQEDLLKGYMSEAEMLN